MLSHDNLARHTLHYQELDVKRDFVQEYLESLEPSAAPELDPERSATTQRTTPAPVPSLKTKGSGEVNSKTSQPRQRHHHHHLHHNHHHNQEKGKKGKQHDSKVPSSPMVGNNNPSANMRVSTHIESTVPKQASKKKTQDNPTTNDNMKRKDVSKARQENTKHKKKRKKQTDDVELDVEKLDINPRYDVHNNALQQEPDHLERIDTRTTAPEKAKPTVSSLKRASKITHHRDGLYGKQPPEQPHSDERQGSRYRLRSSLEVEHSNRTSDRITHLNRHGNNNSNNHTGSIHNRNTINNNNISNKNSNNNSNINNNRKSHNNNNRNKHHNESSHRLAGAIYAHNEDQDEKESRKKDSKRPRKILTQDSLLLNQFASANTTRGRITLPNASSRLGLFQKGKASLKTAVQDHGHGFSETIFLGQTVGTPMPEDHDRPQDVVTSSYFAKPKDGEPTDPVPSPMSENRSGVSASVDTTNTSALSKHSMERRMTQQHAVDDVSRSSKSSDSSIRKNDIPPQLTSKSSNSELSPSTYPASVSPLPSPRRNSPEHTVNAILQELISNDRLESQSREEGQVYGEQRHISQEACHERQKYVADGRMLLEQPFEAPSSGYIDTGQYFDMYGCPLEPQPNTRGSSVQHFTAVSMANPDARNMCFEWHLEPVYRWPSGVGDQGQGYPFHTQGRAVSHPGASTYMQQEESIRLGYDWRNQGAQQGNPMSNSQQTRFEWRPHRFY